MKSFVFLIYKILSFLMLLFPVMLFSQDVILYDENDNGKTYTSIEEALKEPEKVYRLKLLRGMKADSLPDAIFQMKNLRELTVKNCKLLRLNEQIGSLSALQYLNLDKNRLVTLPEGIGALRDLKVLIISRNIIQSLPDAIGNLSQLSQIDAWDNPLYILPESISKLAKTLKVIDLRQVPLKAFELDKMEVLLPATEIIITNICECSDGR